jgi:hypothetical protein
VKSATSFAKSVESKLSKDTIQPKKKINKKSIIELSGIQPYAHENIFQRDLRKHRHSKNSISTQSQSEILTSSAPKLSKRATQSQIFESDEEN